MLTYANLSSTLTSTAGKTLKDAEAMQTRLSQMSVSRNPVVTANNVRRFVQAYAVGACSLLDVVELLEVAIDGPANGNEQLDPEYMDQIVYPALSNVTKQVFDFTDGVSEFDLCMNDGKPVIMVASLELLTETPDLTVYKARLYPKFAPDYDLRWNVVVKADGSLQTLLRDSYSLIGDQNPESWLDLDWCLPVGADSNDITWTTLSAIRDILDSAYIGYSGMMDLISASEVSGTISYDNAVAIIEAAGESEITSAMKQQLAGSDRVSSISVASLIAGVLQQAEFDHDGSSPSFTPLTRPGYVDNVFSCIIAIAADILEVLGMILSRCFQVVGAIIGAVLQVVSYLVRGLTAAVDSTSSSANISGNYGLVYTDHPSAAPTNSRTIYDDSILGADEIFDRIESDGIVVLGYSPSRTYPADLSLEDTFPGFGWQLLIMPTSGIYHPNPVDVRRACDVMIQAIIPLAHFSRSNAKQSNRFSVSCAELLTTDLAANTGCWTRTSEIMDAPNHVLTNTYDYSEVVPVFSLIDIKDDTSIRTMLSIGLLLSFINEWHDFKGDLSNVTTVKGYAKKVTLQNSVINPLLSFTQDYNNDTPVEDLNDPQIPELLHPSFLKNDLTDGDIDSMTQADAAFILFNVANLIMSALFGGSIRTYSAFAGTYSDPKPFKGYIECYAIKHNITKTVSYNTLIRDICGNWDIILGHEYGLMSPNSCYGKLVVKAFPRYLNYFNDMLRNTPGDTTNFTYGTVTAAPVYNPEVECPRTSERAIKIALSVGAMVTVAVAAASFGIKRACKRRAVKKLALAQTRYANASTNLMANPTDSAAITEYLKSSRKLTRAQKRASRYGIKLLNNGSVPTSPTPGEALTSAEENSGASANLNDVMYILRGKVE